MAGFENKTRNHFILATSDDGGGSWSKPRVVVGARVTTGQRLRGALAGNLWTDPPLPDTAFLLAE